MLPITQRKKTSAAELLASSLREPLSYDAIDQMMQTIAKESGISTKELRGNFMKKYGKTPDDYAKSVSEATDETSVLPENKHYFKGLSASTIAARKRHWKKMDKKSDRDPSSYEPAPGDANAKTKPSKHTLAVRKMMKESSADNSLAAKAKKSGISVSTLKAVYRRGVAAWNSGHRPGTTPQQWGHARVNSYIRKGSGTYHGADKDLREDTPVNAVGRGNVAGLGVGPQGEPPGKIAVMKKTPLKRFKDFLKNLK